MVCGAGFQLFYRKIVFGRMVLQSILDIDFCLTHDIQRGNNSVTVFPALSDQFFAGCHRHRRSDRVDLFLQLQKGPTGVGSLGLALLCIQLPFFDTFSVQHRLSISISLLDNLLT